MASDEYSAYEAKARFSELLRKVRQGKRVTITYHGEPVAEMGPIRDVGGVESRVRALRSSGRISGHGNLRGKLMPLAKRPGALERFLSERESEP